MSVHRCSSFTRKGKVQSGQYQIISSSCISHLTSKMRGWLLWGRFPQCMGGDKGSSQKTFSEKLCGWFPGGQAICFKTAAMGLFAVSLSTSFGSRWKRATIVVFRKYCCFGRSSSQRACSQRNYKNPGMLSTGPWLTLFTFRQKHLGKTHWT